jgi:hypothetical protein
VRQSPSRAGFAVLVALLWGGCGGTLDVGANSEGGLPVNADDPVILLNDSTQDNWHGEYAFLLARGGGPAVEGIVVSTGGIWTDLDANTRGWEQLTAAVRDSGFADVPEPLASLSNPLQRPNDDDIDSTVANDSPGARFIAEESRRLFAATAKRVALAVGGRFTDVADAYLIDPTVTDRVVVVASAGSDLGGDGTRAEIGRPNGEMDPWAVEIVVRKFIYVQVAAHYDQLTDVPDERVADLPENPLGMWISQKRSGIAPNVLAADQVSVLVAGLPSFTTQHSRVSPSPEMAAVPTLETDVEGSDYLVQAVDGAAATRRFWQLLLDTP